MKRLATVVFSLLLLFSIMVAAEPRAFAYVDPGSGLVIYQTVGAIATAGLFWFRRRFKGLFTRSTEPAKKPDQSS